MQVSKHLKVFAFILFSMLSFGSTQIRPEDSQELVEESLEQEFDDTAKRGYLSVPSSVGATTESLSVELISPATLGNTTTTLCRCKQYKLLKTVNYAPSSVGGCPMIRMTASGSTLDLAHNCASYCRSDCTTHCIGISVGYSPQELANDPTLTQPSSITIENGMMGKWDIAIVIHAGVKNVTIKNMMFSNNVLPIAMLGENDVDGALENPVANITLEKVSIVGHCVEYRACLDWIRAFVGNGVLANGAAVPDAGAFAYNNGEVMPCVCDPIANDIDGSFVYSGIYGHGVVDLHMKNVHVSSVGFDGNTVEDEDPAPVPAVQAERTVAYGIWLRNSRSIFMEDVASVKNKSAIAAVGAFFDNSELISVKNGNFSSNMVTFREQAQDPNQPSKDVYCCDGLWAAGVVLKDSDTASFCNVVLSENRGIDNVWGLRTMLSAVYDNSYVLSTAAAAATTPAGQLGPALDVYSSSTTGLEFDNVRADGLRADHVYGFDFGDKCRQLYTNINGTVSLAKLPVGAVHKLKMNNVSVCSAKGKVIGADAEEEIAKEFKGICLGDGSTSLYLDDVKVGANRVVLDETCQSDEGVNSGIEFGGQSTEYVFQPVAGANNDLGDFDAAALAATGQAKGTVDDLLMNNIKVSNNLGGSGDGRMVGIRAVATGSNEFSQNGINVFSNIKLSNSAISANQFDNFRAVDDSLGADPTPVTLTALQLDNVCFNSSVDGYGLNVDNLAASSFKDVTFDNNKVRGFHAANVDCVNIDGVSASNTQTAPVNQCGPVATEVYGFDVSNEAVSLKIAKGAFNSTTAVDADVAGLHINCGQSIGLTDVQANCNVSSADAGDGPYTTRGIYFEDKVDGLHLEQVEASSNRAENGNVVGLQVDRATSVSASGVKANNNSAEGQQSTNCNVSTAIGMFFKATVGSKTSEGCILKDLQACGNSNAHLAYGVYMQEPVGLMIDGISGSSNVSSVVRPLLQDGSANPQLLPMLSQAVGIYFEGGSSIHMKNVHASSNNQKEMTAEYLSRHLEKGASINDSEAVKNLSAEIAHHFAVANRSGAYGILADGTQDLSIEYGVACNNSGVRAFGIHGRHVDNSVFKFVDASENIGTGTPFINENPFNLTNPNSLNNAVNSGETDPNNVDVADAQAECVFGGVDPATKIDLKQTYAEILVNLKRHAASFLANDECVNVDPCDRAANTDSCLTSSINLFWSTIAPCRRFSTGAGIGMYSSTYAMIEESRAVNNHSLCDSGGGFVFYGKGGEGHSIVKSVAANNEGYKQSERGGMDSFNIDGNIDITKWRTLYNFLDVGLLRSETVNVGASNDTYGFEIIPNVVIAADHIDEESPIVVNPQRKPTPDGAGLLTQPEGETANTYTLDRRRMTVGILPTADPESASVEQRIDLCDFVGVGPIGVGILLECQRDCNVADNNTFGNKGHSSLGFGILSDAASASMFIDNKATNNGADALGYAWGLADMAASSPNIWYKNWMYANRVDTFMNSSYLIIFDNAVSAGQSLPVREIFPGSLETLINSVPLENIIVKFVSDRQEFDCVGNLVTNKWMSTDLVSCGM